MTNSEMEEKLSEQGFSAKEIALLKHRVEQDTTTYQALLIDLSRRFIGALILLAVVIFFYMSGFFIREHTDVTAVLITLGFTFIVTWYVAPLKLGAKAYFFRRRNRYL
ncbi:hypothetical protein [Erwinia sp. PsM31]|uniref:hypothetical protein n=1 Tax=Erwinia sp. PsM31 TaxID=3030535 RepID=UPI00263AF12A|nr:hypothetical protein [Erwinia sp. PsM31]MDN4627085.1 hypothetical protein [Erwinia sp. PsM31]